MTEHEWNLAYTIENYDRGGVDFIYWCKQCGTLMKKSGRIDEEIIYHIPVGYGNKPNSQECINEKAISRT